MTGYELTGRQWQRLEPLLPPERYGQVGTVSSRFYRWCQPGLWPRLLSTLQAEADARGEIDWDPTLWMPPLFGRISTPPALAGLAPSGGEVPDEALGRSQVGFSTKLHLRAEGGGKPINAVLTGGERHEQIALEGLLDGGAIRRSGRGRPRLRRLAGD